MKNMKKIEFYIEDIIDTIIAADNNRDIWIIYKSKDTRPQFSDVMESYCGFFSTSIHAHFVAMIIALYRLFETRPDTISFPQLIKLLKEKNRLSEGARTEIEVLMEKAKPIWINIGIVRSEVFAHSTNKRSSKESFKKAAIKIRQFKDIIDLSKTIINMITQDYNRSTHAFNLSAEHDTKCMLGSLQKTL